MSMCPALELIAAAASGGQADDHDAAMVLAHAVACPRCAILLAEQRELRTFAHRLPVPALDRSRRAELAAEIMARADAAPRERRMVRVAIAASFTVAIAATIAIVLAMRSTDDLPGDEQQVAITPAPPKPAPHVEPPPAPPAPEREPAVEPSTGTKIVRTRGTTELVELSDGSVTIDSQQSREVDVTAGTTRVAVGRAKAAVTATRGVIRSVQVFAGSVEVIQNGKKQVVAAGTVWRSTDLLTPPVETPKPEPTSEPAKPASEVSLQAFREGYVALRAGRNADAIAAFDRATDPVVAEDAMFWAAVAADRLGDKDDAVRRYTAFLASFGSSPRAGDAKAAIVRLGTSPSVPSPKGL